jgi:hypothetical protein
MHNWWFSGRSNRSLGQIYSWPVGVSIRKLLEIIPIIVPSIYASESDAKKYSAAIMIEDYQGQTDLQYG